MWFVLSSGVEFSSSLRKHPKLWEEVYRRFSFWEECLVRRLQDLQALGVRVLLELGEEHGVSQSNGLRIDLPLSQQDLADLVGASRQTVCQELQKLARRELIRLEGRRIILADVAALRRLG